MSDDNVVEIDFDMNEEVLDPNEVDLPPMESKTTELQVGILGRNNLSKLVEIMYSTPIKTQDIIFTTYDDVDSLLLTPITHLVFITLNSTLNDNDELDDAEIVNAVKKISTSAQSSIVLKTTVGIPTLNKIMTIVNPDKFVYCPESVCDDNLDEMLKSDIFFAGGTQKAVNDITTMTNGLSSLGKRYYQGTVYDIALTKLLLSGFKAVSQTFWNQAHDYITNETFGNFNIIKKMFDAQEKDTSVRIPSFIKARIGDQLSYKKSKSFSGEYTNTDVRIFAGLTDKLPLVDECINYKNLKD